MITPAITRRTVIVAASVAVLACFLLCGEPPPPPPRPLVLELFVTPDAWEPGEDRVLTDPIETFNRERATVDGRVIRVEPVHRDSGTVEEMLVKRPSEAPDVWIPASRVWSELLAYTHPDLVAYEAPTLIKSPQVLAVWEDVADDLGPRLAWRDVLTFVRNPAEWSRRADASGPFRLAHTDPQRSTSGLSAAVSEFYLAAGKTENLEINDVFRGVGTVQKIQEAIVHYGPTSGDILEQFACYGTSYASAVYIQETSLRRFNEGGYASSEACSPVNPDPTAKLHGYYPADGTFIAEYPCVTMDPLEVGTRQSAANFFCEWLADHLQQTSAVICNEYHYVVPGRQCGGPIPRKTLPVPSSGVLNEIQEQWPRYRRAADVILAVDTSLSMEERLGGIRREISTCLEDLVERDRLGLVLFGDDVQLPVSLGNYEPARPIVVDAIRNAAPQGASTRLLDGIGRAFTELQSDPSPERIAAIVVLTDGATEDPSGTTIASLIDRLRTTRHPTPIFLVEMEAGSVDPDVKRELLRASRGRAFVVGSTDDPRSPGTSVAELCAEVFSFF